MNTTVTIQLPEDVGRRAEERAAREGTTLSEVLRKMAEEFADELDLLEDEDDVRVAREIEARIKRGEESVLEWADVARELDALSD